MRSWQGIFALVLCACGAGKSTLTVTVTGSGMVDHLNVTASFAANDTAMMTFRVGMSPLDLGSSPTFNIIFPSSKSGTVTVQVDAKDVHDLPLASQTGRTSIQPSRNYTLTIPLGSVGVAVDQMVSNNDQAVIPDQAIPDQVALVDGTLPPDQSTLPDLSCPPMMTMCGNRCVDLSADIDNCGACGYRVISAVGRNGDAQLRRCVSGQPSPGWVPIGTANGPVNPPVAAAWTGAHLLHLAASSEVKLYDPNTDGWSTGPAAPLAITSDNYQLVSMTDRGLVFLWGGHSTSVSNSSFILDDHNAPSWQTVATSGAPSPRFDVSLVYTGTDVFVFYGRPAADSGSDDGGRYKLASSSWSPISASSSQSIPDCYNGALHAETPFAFANGLIAGFGGQASDGSCCAHPSEFPGARYDPGASSWLTLSSAIAPSRLAHTWLSVGSQIFVAGGDDCYKNSKDYPDAYLFDPRGVATAVTRPTLPSVATSNSWALFTGRAIFYFSGESWISGATHAGGALGVVSGNSVTWQPLPSTGAPVAQYIRGNSNIGNTQNAWSGYEALVYGGITTLSGMVNARYQPPVGCVCPINAGWPSASSAACVNVTSVPAAYAACSP